MDGLATYLVEHGKVSTEDIEAARRLTENDGRHLIHALSRVVRHGAGDLVDAVAAFYDVPVVAAAEWPARSAIPPEAETLSLSFLRTHGLFPLGQSTEGASAGLIVAMIDPGDLYAAHAVRLATGQPVIPKAASAHDIANALERLARVRDDRVRDDATNRGVTAETTTSTAETSGYANYDREDDVEHLRDLALGTPVIRIVNGMLSDALQARATDIHIEPYDGRLRVRFRTDGILRDVRPPDAALAKAIVSRIKIIAGLNIAERRLPQDGRIRLRMDGRVIDLRVATMPTIHGESAAIRLLDNVRRELDLDLLGFSQHDARRLLDKMSLQHGLIVATGPTGSGKTTTLAAMLSRLNNHERKILTIEDPIEYEFDGISQTQAKPSIGLTFAQALRSFLRHDPDVIMVGEMRDAETAKIGIHAALTGHLVLTTLHTNTASGAVPRLLDMGVDGYLLASSLRCVVAQRLARLLCPACRAPMDTAPVLPPRLMELLQAQNDGERKLWRAVGCERCFGTGYTDRTVISEVLEVDETIAELVHRRAPAPQIEAAARKNGMTTMLEDGFAKCLAGLMTTDEVVRVAMGD